MSFPSPPVEVLEQLIKDSGKKPLFQIGYTLLNEDVPPFKDSLDQNNPMSGKYVF